MVEVRPIKHECPHDGCTHKLSIMPSGNFSIGLGPAPGEWERTCSACGRTCDVRYLMSNRLGDTYPEFLGCELLVPEASDG